MEYPGRLIAIDTAEKIISGCRRYLIAFEDIYARFSSAWATKSHVSKAAEEFFELCLKVFPYSFNFLRVLTDNGSEFRKHFAERLKELHLIRYHTYPKCPQMNTHLERFNRTIREEFIDYFIYLLTNPDAFNRKLVDYLIFCNTERVRCTFQNKLSPVQFMAQRQKQKLLQAQLQNQSINQLLKIPAESNNEWHYTRA